MNVRIPIAHDRSKCQQAGCIHYSLDGARLCISCKKKATARHMVRWKALKRKDKRTAHEQGYDVAWRKISKAYRMKHPICEVCESSLTDIVDHIVPLKDGGTHADDNLQALCHVDHNRKTSLQNLHGRRSHNEKRHTIIVY